MFSKFKAMLICNYLYSNRKSKRALKFNRFRLF